MAWASVWSDGNRQFKEVSDLKMRSEVLGSMPLYNYTKSVLCAGIEGAILFGIAKSTPISIAGIWSQLMRLHFKSMGSIYE